MPRPPLTEIEKLRAQSCYKLAWREARRRFTNNDWLNDELVSRAMEILCTASQTYTEDKGSFSNYVVQILACELPKTAARFGHQRGLSRTQQRHNHINVQGLADHDQFHPEDESVTQPPDDVINAETKTKFRKILASLPKNTRDDLIAYAQGNAHIRGFMNQEPANAVRTRAKTIIQRLNAKYGE